jgi:hypothetical protein
MLSGTHDRANCWRTHDTNDGNKKAHPLPGGLLTFPSAEAEIDSYSTEKLCNATGSAV